MPTNRVTLTPHPPGADAQPRDFTIGDEDEAEVGPRQDPHIVSPKILIVTVVAVIFFLFSLVYDSAPPQLTALQRRVRDEKVMERQVGHFRNEHRADGAELQRLMASVEKQVLIVSRAEARGDKPLARQELLKLMRLDGDHSNSPLYRFCVSRIKEYG
jgi:hypothetical protein